MSYFALGSQATCEQRMSKFSDSWHTLEPVQKGVLIGMLTGAVFALLMWHLSWVAAGFGIGAGIGYFVGQRKE